MTSTPSTILLIDDHPMLRNGVKQLIALDASLAGGRRSQ